MVFFQFPCSSKSASLNKPRPMRKVTLPGLHDLPQIKDLRLQAPTVRGRNRLPGFFFTLPTITHHTFRDTGQGGPNLQGSSARWLSCQKIVPSSPALPHCKTIRAQPIYRFWLSLGLSGALVYIFPSWSSKISTLESFTRYSPILARVAPNTGATSSNSFVQPETTKRGSSSFPF